MTFTFKLARRLALSHLVPFAVLGVLATGCAPGKPLEGGLEPPPDSVLGIQLFPDSVSLHPTEFVDFAAIAELPGGGNGRVPVDWQADGGTITTDGRYTAGNSAGSYKVIGRYRNGKADTSKVTIQTAGTTPVETGIDVTPITAALLPGATQQFSVAGIMSDGSSIPVSVNWSTTGGSVDGSGFYTAPTPAGTYLVIAAQPGSAFADTARVTVSTPPPSLAAVILAPGSAALQFGQTQQFNAQGQLSDGSLVAIAVTWTATGGTVNSTGLYTAGNSAGNFRVIARSANGLADTSTVTVTAPTVTGITLTPATTALQSGQTQQFLASATLSNGGTQANPAVTWTATGGAINGSGLYTAGATPGTFRVIAASAAGPADTSTITITLPTVSSITVTPATATVASGATQQFTATATLSNGATQANPSVTWTATGGTINTSGLYTAGASAGTFRVIASSSNGHADTSSVTVTTTTITAVTLTPATVSLQTAQTQQFSVTATLSNGGTQSNPTVTWSATGGTISNGGLYTAGNTAGTFRLIATASGGAADTSSITITAATVTGIVVTPAAVTLGTSQTQQFTASAMLSNGGTQANPAVTWSATGGTVSSSGLYTAGSTTGTFRVIAVQQGGSLADTSAVTIATSAPRSMFFNSSEAGCGTDPNVVLCDDFEDGSWYEKNCDLANASGGLLQVDGWCGSIYSDPTTPANGAVCGGQGFRSNCAATSGALTGAVGGRNMADHNLGPNNNGYNEIYLRYYIRTSPGYSYGSQKMITFNSTPAGSGGISIGGSGSPFGDGAYDTCPVYDCNTTGAVYYYRQNQGQTLHLSQITGHWAFVEMHVKLNTPGQANGVWELWVNDCGTDGLSCGSAPILRSRFTTVQWQGPSDNKQIMSIWFENWANPGSVGTEYYDQIKVSRVGPIGFMP